jgi:tight adherence protein B
MNAPIANFDRQVPLLIRNLEVCLRSGYSLLQTFEIIARDLPAPIGADAQWVIDEIKANRAFPQVFDQWLLRTPSRDLDLVLAMIRVQFEVGGNLADKLNLLGQVLEKRKIAPST